jgi:hypothetical protein
LDDPEFESSKRQEILLFPIAGLDGSGAHPASYSMGTGGFFPGGEAACAEIKNERKYTSTPYSLNNPS